MSTIDLHTIEQGGINSAKGFCADGIHAGFRVDVNRLDTALLEAEELCSAAGVFTQNVFCAAPVMLSRGHLGHVGYGLARAVLINSGTANAATGAVGFERARESAKQAAGVIGCSTDQVLVASTGVIGQQLDIAPFQKALPALHKSISALQNGIGAEEERAQAAHRAAKAIMTTDTVPKEQAMSYVSNDPQFKGVEFCVGGMAKGSGMIMPNMATMIALLTTDAPVRPELLHKALTQAVQQSFNKVTVDSDTSTNDTCILMASGKACASDKGFIEEHSCAYDEFCAALNEVTQRLARMMARDGEGATRLITVKVTGARTEEDADKAARTVANSPLVKTAIFGHDANWGRIAAALGRSGAAFKQEQVSIDIMGLAVLREGLPVPFDEEEALRRFELPEIILEANLGAGLAETTVWTCDFSYEYVKINGEYRT